MARKPLMAGNWKMNLDHLDAVRLVQKLAWTLDDKKHDPAKSEVVVLPPFTNLRSVQTLVDGDRLELGYGAQDVSPHLSGAFTGEVSAEMLAKLGCRYVVVGHSERREYHHEDDQIINAKAAQALKHGLSPIVCVGEGVEARAAGEHVEHTLNQLAGALADHPDTDVAKVVIAYEPLWAVGTGQVATPENIQEVCGEIRGWVAEHHGNATAAQARVLYGGSVKASNIVSIMANPDVDGVLVGGASLHADEFAAIARFYDLPAL